MPSLRLILLMTLLLAACQPARTSTLTPQLASTLAPTLLAPTQAPTAAAPATRLPAPTAQPPAPTPTFGPTPVLYHGQLQRVPDELIPSPPDGLTLDVYKMSSGPDTDEGYDPILRVLGQQSRLSRLPQGRYSWDTAALELMAADNAALTPFGYRLESKAVEEGTSRWYVLYQGEKVILDPVTELGQVSVNRSGTDFMLVVQGDAGPAQLVRKGSLEPWKFTFPMLADSRPQFLGDDVMHVELRQEAAATAAQTPAPPRHFVQVFRGDQVIAEIPYQEQGVALGFYGFWTYGEHWAVETADHVVIDGQDVNQQNGYDKSYEFHLLGGKPLFFFEKGGTPEVSYDGKTARLPFASIPHYGCCSAGQENPFQAGDVLIFYGLNADNWFYVELAEKEYAGP